ncbi:hypothetical protein ACJ41O_012258 [Fusarium nematophilum]
MDFTYLSSSYTILAALGAVAPVSALLVYLYFVRVDFPKVQGIPEIPGGATIAGHLYQLGNDHATTAASWSARYGWPVFQFRMGRRRAIMLNSFEATRNWLVKNQSATIDRPWFYTFHGIVSRTSAATIGTSPWNERTKKQRRVVGSFTTGPSIKKMKKMLDMETFAVISGLYYEGQKGTADISPHLYQKRLALNIMIMFCYGSRFTSIKDPMLLQILRDAKIIASFRSTNSNAQDFIPHLRYLGKNPRTALAMAVRNRRDAWLATMLDNVKSNLNHLRPGDKKCVAEMLLEDSQEGLTQFDVKTILGGLMSGGFETVYSTVIITIGMLSTTQGQPIQDKAYKDILDSYDSLEDAFEQCILEEKSQYVTGLVKEALRFYPPLKILPARQVYKDFVHEGATIPRGLLFYINTQAVNFDRETYGPDADEFRPERWTEKDRDVPPPYHFAFGAGARMCTAVNFSNRLLYAIFVRLILSFKMAESKEMPPSTHYIDYKEDPTAANAIAADFKVRFKPRDEEALESLLKKAQGELTEFVAGDNPEPLFRSKDKGDRIIAEHGSTSRGDLDYIIVPDIAREGAFDGAVQSQPPFEYVIHTASPFPDAFEDPIKGVLDPAVKGTTGILGAIRDHAPKVKRVVLTSSFAAIVNTASPPRVYDETSWNPIIWDEAVADTSLTYRGSKKLAEQAAWDFMEKEKPMFDLVTMNPPLVYGPIAHHLESLSSLNTSNQRIRDFIQGNITGNKLPPTGTFLFTDVRDLALAHARAISVPQAGGNRFFITAGHCSNKQIVEAIRETHPELTDRLPGSPVDDFPENVYGYDNSRARQILGIEFRSLTDCIGDTVTSLLKVGAVEQDSQGS